MVSGKDILLGKPVRSPLHPMLVHLPLALFPLSLLFDLASWLWDRPELQLPRGAFICLALGLLSGIVASVVGMVDYTEIRNDHPAKKPATLHFVLNLLALGLFAVGTGLRYGELDTPRTSVAPLTLSVLGLGLLGYSGFLGGKIVYADGVGVGRHRRRAPPPETTLVIQTNGGAGPVAVADDTALREGGMLRVELDGVALLLARVQGRVHAVQDFCPHRFAPLSDGALQLCEIECPWHRSRFDLRTGKVLAGPAKVDVRTFSVTLREGKLWVEKGPA